MEKIGRKELTIRSFSLLGKRKGAYVWGRGIPTRDGGGFGGGPLICLSGWGGGKLLVFKRQRREKGVIENKGRKGSEGKGEKGGSALD